MTSQNSQLQTLINEIDEVLKKTSPRLPWVMSSDALQQRQVLEQTRKYLASIQQQAASQPVPQPNEAEHASKNEPPATDSALITPTPVTPQPRLQGEIQADSTAESAQQVLQAVLQEMNYLRSNLLQPLRSDIDLMQRQRDVLMQEVRQLEAQRQQYVLPPQPVNQQLLVEFLQSAMGQMQENLKGQVAQMLASITQSPQGQPLLESSAPSAVEQAALSPVQRLEYLQMVQSQSDQLLMKLDSTLRVIFESLQSNIASYQDSLEQGLSRMYHLGQEGEAVFATLVSRLAEQLGREASSYLKSSMQTDWAAQQSSPPEENPLPEGNRAAEIARLLDELNSLTPDTPETARGLSSAETAPAAADPRWQPPDPLPPDPSLGNLEALSLELDRLELTETPPEQLDFVEDESLPALFEGDQEFPTQSESEAVTRIQGPQTRIQEPSTRIQDNSEAARTSIVRSSPPPDDDLESALDLLNQLSAEIDAEIQPTASTGTEPPLNVKPAPAPAEIELVPAPESLYNDEFYQSLFGNPAGLTADEPTQVEVAEPNGEDWFAGLSDSARVAPESPAETPTPADRPGSDLSQSGESLLLGGAEPHSSNVNPPNTQRFQEKESSVLPESEITVAPDPPASSPAPVQSEEDVETIAALTDLLPPDQQSQPVEPPTRQTASNTAEEGYEQARSDEDLLAIETPKTNFVPELDLPTDTLQQLTTDLSALEAQRASALPDAEAATASNSWAVADWQQAQAESGAQSAATSAENGAIAPSPNEIDLIDLEDRLFGDEFASPAAQEREASLQDLFSSVASDPEVTPESVRDNVGDAAVNDAETSSTAAQSASDSSTENKKEEEPNTFTLEGLESLFDSILPLDTAPPPLNEDRSPESRPSESQSSEPQSSEPESDDPQKKN